MNDGSGDKSKKLENGTSLSDSFMFTKGDAVPVALSTDHHQIPTAIQHFLDEYFFKVGFSVSEEDKLKLAKKTGLSVGQIENWFKNQDKLEKLKVHYGERYPKKAEILAKRRMSFDDLEQKVKELILETADGTGHSPEYVSYWLQKRPTMQQEAEKELFSRSFKSIAPKVRLSRMGQEEPDSRMLTSPFIPRFSTSLRRQHSFRSIRSLKRAMEHRAQSRQTVVVPTIPSPILEEETRNESPVFPTSPMAMYHVDSESDESSNESFIYTEISV